MRTARALALYAVLTVALTWPFAANLRVMDAGDSAFFAWEIGWTVHALETDPASLPHANIFHPLRYTLGMDEPVFGTTLLVLPFAPFTDDAVLLYNVVRLLTFLVSALTAFWLAKELGVSEWIALLAGALFAFSPIRTDQVAHLSTLGTQWWPLVLLYTIRFAKRGLAKDALLAALFFVLAFLACGYHGVIAAAVLPPALLVLFWGRWDRLEAGRRGGGARGARAAARLPDAPESARAGALLPRHGRNDPVRGSRRVLPGDELVEPPVRRGDGRVPGLGPEQPVPRPRGPGPGRWPAHSRFGEGASGRRARPGLSRALLLAAVFVALGPRVRGVRRRSRSRPVVAAARHDPALPDDPRDEPGRRLHGAAARDAGGAGARDAEAQAGRARGRRPPGSGRDA